VTFQYLVQQGTIGQDLRVDLTDSSAVNLASDPIAFTNTTWTLSSLNFTATTTSTTISFTDTTPLANTGGANWALDAVTVATSAPEASTSGMVGIGLVTLSLLLWRRRKLAGLSPAV
jgi:hypothetical protein